jgi:hypothetical protein
VGPSPRAGPRPSPTSRTSATGSTHGSFRGQEPPGYAAPGILGEAWANFGPLGLALFLLLGLVAERLGAFLALRRRTTVDLVAGALLVVFLARTHALGVNGLAVLVVLVIAWRVPCRWWAWRDGAIGPGRAGVARLSADRPSSRAAVDVPSTGDGSGSASLPRSSSLRSCALSSVAGHRWHPTMLATCMSGCRSWTDMAAHAERVDVPAPLARLRVGPRDRQHPGRGRSVGRGATGRARTEPAGPGRGRCASGWLLAGPGGVFGTAFALVAAALIWRLMPSLRIDLPQTACDRRHPAGDMWRPTTRRWARWRGPPRARDPGQGDRRSPLLILPVAFVGSVPPSAWVGSRRSSSLAAVMTAGWWWLVVWLSTGQVFPLNALSVIEARDVDVALRGRSLDGAPARAGGRGLGHWSPWHAVHDRGARVLLVAAIGLAPAALYAASLGLNARNFAGLAVLSAVAVGAGGAWLVALLRQRRTTGSPGQRRLATIALIGVAVVGDRGPGRRPAGRRSGGTRPHRRRARCLARGERARRWSHRDGVSRARTDGPPPVRSGGRGDPADRAGRCLGGTGGLRVDGACATASCSATGVPPGATSFPARSEGPGSPADLLVLVGPHPFTPTALTATSGIGAGPWPHPGHHPRS